MLILASSSSFRMGQLKQINLEFKSISPNLNEESFKDRISDPIQLSRELSLAKANTVFETNKEHIIIGSDQVLSLSGEIYNKPGNKERAELQLQKLQGKTHQLITSFAIVSKDKTVVDTVISEMTMRTLNTEQIKKYVDMDEPFYSCGSYKLETIGISLFESIVSNDHSSIIGLPLISLTTKLKEFDIEVL